MDGMGKEDENRVQSLATTSSKEGMTNHLRLHSKDAGKKAQIFHVGCVLGPLDTIATKISVVLSLLADEVRDTVPEVALAKALLHQAPGRSRERRVCIEDVGRLFSNLLHCWRDLCEEIGQICAELDDGVVSGQKERERKRDR